jgi:dTDP-glucose 4,6-dehydratase
VKLLVTGGCGFIGSQFVRMAVERGAEVVNLDKLTYAGNPENVADISDHPRHTFVQGDVADAELVGELVDGVDAVVNFAAESHVDRSILDPTGFVSTDVLGPAVLLQALQRHGGGRFVQVSTDEVYGPIPEGEADETAPLRPSSPYSASKAGGELQAMAWFTTYGADVVITRGANTYGPRQYPEKLIPLFVTNALDGLPLPVYGDGRQVRNWIHVVDHCEGIWTAMQHGAAGEVYNIGGGHYAANLEITRLILQHTGRGDDLISHVPDRPGHDRRYALDSSKLRALGWASENDFDRGLADTVSWYRDNRGWWEPIKSGEYRRYYERQYGAL